MWTYFFKHSVQKKKVFCSPLFAQRPSFECTLTIRDFLVNINFLQAYFYEFNNENQPVQRPRHILPYAVVEFKRSEDIDIPNPHLLDPALGEQISAHVSKYYASY